MDEMNVQPNRIIPLKREGMVKAKKKLEVLISNEYCELKTRVHDRLIGLMDLSLVDSIDENLLRQEIKKLAEMILSDEEDGIPLNYSEREQFLREIQDEVLGL